MTFGVVLTITNPFSSGYLAPFAAIKAWQKIADEIIIIDGGSNDKSIEFLRDISGNNSKVKIIFNNVTFWGKGDNWHGMQLGVSLNHGLSLLKTDWGYAFSADYIPHHWDKQQLYRYFAQYKDAYWIRTFVGKPINGRITHNLNKRNILFNLRKMREDKLRIVYGIDNVTNIPGDFPVIAEERAFFIDPVNKIRKYIYRGTPVKSDYCIDLECIAYGHFFYNMKQLEYKIKRWDTAFAKFLGIAQGRLFHLKLWHRVPVNNQYYSKEELLEWDHPIEIKELIDEFYQPGMIGSIKDKASSYKEKISKILMFIFKIERKLRTLWLKVFFGMKAQKDDLIWEK